MSLNDAIVEDAALTWFGVLGYAVGHGPQLAPGEPAAERDGFGEVGRLREAIRRLNPAIPEEAPACASHADRRATIRDFRTLRFERNTP